MAKIKLVPMVLIAVVAIGIAFAAALAVYSKFNKEKTPTIVKPVDVDRLPIAVAGMDVPWGTVIEKNMVKMVPYLKEGLPSGYFSDLHALEGRTLVYPVKEGEPIFESRLAPTSVTGGIAAVITPKKRAMSVKVNSVIGISGFINPNHRVDVLVTMVQKTGGSITKVVLENILVLAVGTSFVKGTIKHKLKREVSVITLEVTPEEGEQLALATNNGTIQLALRNFVDAEEVITPGSTSDTLLASYSPTSYVSKETKSTSSPRIRQMYNVTVIKGTSVSKVAF